MESVTKVIGQTENEPARGFMSGLMVPVMKVTSSMTNSMDTALSLTSTARLEKGSGLTISSLVGINKEIV